ncbi:MAG: hypothetical protein EA400_18480 [Chromatiaceae bacterium]|nr:MAG: hypothetical protein EA400_18480 [Chromatiaceae bacterium]
MRATALCLLAGALLAASGPVAAEWRVLEEAREIINIASVLSGRPDLPVQTYKSAGDNPVPDDVWPSYELSLPFLKNTTRNLQFNESAFLASPGAPIGVTSYITTPDGYTWAAMSEAINALWPYDPAAYDPPSSINTYFAGNFEVTPPPGVVKVTVNYKGQNMKFWAYAGGAAPGRGSVALDRYFVTDEWGNEYIMHASGERDAADVRAAFDRAVLPPGWKKSIRRLGRDLVLRPAVSDDPNARFHYLVIRDSADNTYHQVGWSRRGSLAAQVPGMPIWGSLGRDILTGDADGVRDDQMYGGGGGDLFRPGLGTNTVWGSSQAVDTVELPGWLGDYMLVWQSEDGASFSLSGPDSFHTLHHIDRLRFKDGGTAKVADFLGRSVH